MQQAVPRGGLLFGGFMKLALNAAVKFVLGLLMCGVLLFAPAGTLHYPGAWAFLALLFVPMLALGVWLYVKHPALLEKRLENRETQTAQKAAVGLSGLLFVLGFVLCGLDHRFDWTHVPMWLRVLSAAVQLLAYGAYAEVMRENAWLSRTVHVHKDQQVVDSGLYGVVRHPMYMATVFLFLSIPLVLGSWIGFSAFVPFVPVLMLRIRAEEQLLEAELRGYTAYQQKVKWRLIPWVW